MMMGGGPMAPKSTSMAMNPRFVVMYLHGTRSKISFKYYIVEERRCFKKI